MRDRESVRERLVCMCVSVHLSASLHMCMLLSACFHMRAYAAQGPNAPRQGNFGAQCHVEMWTHSQ